MLLDLFNFISRTQGYYSPKIVWDNTKKDGYHEDSDDDARGTIKTGSKHFTYSLMVNLVFWVSFTQSKGNNPKLLAVC